MFVHPEIKVLACVLFAVCSGLEGGQLACTCEN